jgi:hypothetical protein
MVCSCLFWFASFQDFLNQKKNEKWIFGNGFLKWIFKNGFLTKKKIFFKMHFLTLESL